MARYVSNPQVFGEDVVSLAWMGFGVALTGAINDKVVSPVVGQVVPASFKQEMTGKVVDSVSTMATGWGLGEVVGFIDKQVAKKLKMGGLLLGVAKAVSIVVPGFALTGTLPGAIGSRIPNLMPPPPPKALNGNGNGAGQSLAQIGVGTSGL